jgi:hypothetical protein
MNYAVIAHRMTRGMRGVLIAHLDAIFPLMGEVRAPRSAGFVLSANALIAMGLLRINNFGDGKVINRTRLTEDGRGVLAALLALYADQAITSLEYSGTANQSLFNRVLQPGAEPEIPPA